MTDTYRNTISGDRAKKIGERGGAIIAELIECNETVRISTAQLENGEWVVDE